MSVGLIAITVHLMPLVTTPKGHLPASAKKDLAAMG